MAWFLFPGSSPNSCERNADAPECDAREQPLNCERRVNAPGHRGAAHRYTAAPAKKPARAHLRKFGLTIHQRDRVEFDGIISISHGAVCGASWKGRNAERDEGYGLIDLYDAASFGQACEIYGWAAKR